MIDFNKDGKFDQFEVALLEADRKPEPRCNTPMWMLWLFLIFFCGGGLVVSVCLILGAFSAACSG